MADGFHTEDIEKYVESVVSFWGKKITIRETINTKLKKYILCI